MKYEVRRYKPEDYFKVQRREFDSFTFGKIENKEEVAKALDQGMAFTIDSEKGIVACGGALPIWPGMAETWLSGSPLILDMRFSFAKEVKNTIQAIISHYKLDRLQTVVDEEFYISALWLERMGFRLEGKMEKYIAGKTFLRYAWIRRN